jgi:WD40 repeat protein
VEVRLNEEVEMFSCTFSRDGRQLVKHCKDNTLRICSVSNAQLIKVIQLNGGDGRFSFVGITADGCQVVSVKNQFNSPGLPGLKSVRLCDVHGDVANFEDICLSFDPRRRGSVSKIAISPLDNSIAIMTPQGVVKLAHRRAQHVTWTVQVAADGKCFDTTVNLTFSTSGQLLATARFNRGLEIWDAIKGKCLRAILSDRLCKLEISPDGKHLAAMSGDSRLWMLVPKRFLLKSENGVVEMT